jgi:hypothetical protein
MTPSWLHLLRLPFLALLFLAVGWLAWLAREFDS